MPLPYSSRVVFMWLVAAVTLALLLVSRPTAASVTYTQATSGLQRVTTANVAWGDYDNDGDLDFVVAADTLDWNTGEPAILTILYHNDGGGAFTSVEAGLPAVDGTPAWGDCDADGDLDLLLVGTDAVLGPSCRIYGNNGDGTFSDIAAGLPGRDRGSAEWGDYDADGDLDLLIAAAARGNRAPRVCIYRNDGGAFTALDAGLAGTGRASWGDADGDGDLDVLVDGDAVTVYRNDGADAFTDLGLGLPAGTAAWGDYDNDGDLDILLAGSVGPSSVTTVYANDGYATFSDIGLDLIGWEASSLVWGDYDNDGDPDFLISGRPADCTDCEHTAIFDNGGGGTFSDANLDLWPGDAAWGDYDADGDLDVLISGSSLWYWQGYTDVFAGTGAPANTAPAAPDSLCAALTYAGITFSWRSAMDAQTPPAALTYNVRAGTAPGGTGLLPPMADAATGHRLVVGPGNAGGRTARSIAAPGAGQTVHWSVQTVDGAHAGSPFAAERTFTQSFTVVPAGLANARLGDMAWGDYDNDGDLDLALCGVDTMSRSRIYRNDGTGIFTDIAAGLPGVRDAAVAWGDYDNDGDLDLALCGMGTTYLSSIYRNDGGAFTDIAAGLPGVRLGALGWGDCDNDGDLDLAISGQTGSTTRITALYRNDGGVFTDVAAGLPGVMYSALAWGDCDNDGDLDLALAGATETQCLSRIYRNDGDSFTDLAAGLPGVRYGTLAWGDCDNDGDLDIALAGATSTSATAPAPITAVWRNDGGTFTDLAADLPGAYGGALAWADYDNDGGLDLFLAGDTGSGEVGRLYRNAGDGSFTCATDLQAFKGGASAWGDFDNDGDLDLVLGGITGFATDYRVRSVLYRSDLVPPNTAPTAPGDLVAVAHGDSITFRWTAASDAQTPTAGLTYDLRVGTTPGGCEIMAVPADPTSGQRRVAETGNVGQRTSWTLALEPGTYYWSVQAVDGAFAGSPFAPERSVGPTTEVLGERPREMSFALAGTNPVAGNPRFRFGLPADAHVRLNIYDVGGRHVADLMEGDRPAGYATVEWTDTRAVGAGVYFARFVADGRTFTTRVVLLR